ncbi:acetyltransferase domain-containing protein [Xylaria sp. FL1777]|nr:acetyltransferase domain-containing protein [Xylaria sp. FL1777]
MTSPSTNIAVRTTLPRLPLPPSSARPAIHTARLLLRPLTHDDLEAYHALRKQAAFMSESSLGVPDATEAETRTALEDLADSDKPGRRETFIFGIFVAATGELIGDGGVHAVRSGTGGWPELGYKLAPAHWGRGYATEAMRAVLAAWWELPREEVEVEIHADTLRTTKEEGEGEGEGVKLARECISAEIATYNKGSQKVLEKLGFEHFGTWEEPDTQLHRLGQPLELGHYVLASTS